MFIVDVDKPDSCRKCPMARFIRDVAYCLAFGGEEEIPAKDINGYPEWCPIVPDNVYICKRVASDGMDKD